MNKQEKTYTVLRDRIHSGEYGPLARFNIDALARELDVSAIPVREALRRLEAEGWVQFKPNSGAIVAPISTTSWEQAMATLAVLEAAASADAQAHLVAEDFVRLRLITQKMAELPRGGDPFRFSELNNQFHNEIVSKSQNEVLKEVLEQTHRRLDRVRQTMFVYLPLRSEQSLVEHEQLLKLLESGTADDVEQYAKWHKLQTIEAYRAIHRANDDAQAARLTGMQPSLPPIRVRSRTAKAQQ